MSVANDEVGLKLLVGAEAFWASARLAIACARRRVLIQAMSFEGDGAGLSVAEAIRSSPAVDRRVLVDDYTRVNINDRPIASRAARRDPALRAEIVATDAMFRRLVADGIAVRVTNPIQMLGLNYPSRNHKKLIVADDVAYIGGINFSDHNFAWPDLMLRMEGAAAADFLALDFDRTFRGRGQSSTINLGSSRLMALDGRSNNSAFGELLAWIGDARDEIVVVSPYLTAPFTKALGVAARAGARVRVFTPWLNNKPVIRDALLWATRRYDLELVLAPVMSHLKGMLIDGERLVLGSSNFDFASLAAEEEILAIVSDPGIISDFRARVIAPAVEAAVAPIAAQRINGLGAHAALRAAALVASATRGFPRRAVDWPR